MCDLSSDTKTEVEDHFGAAHPAAQFCMIRTFFVDLNNPETASEARREPLWRRNMPGLRHIRGILFDERDAYLYEEQMGKANSAVPPVSFCVSAAPV